ncbi:hypothetical protein [Sphingobacterium thalpophilum]|uniref:hypothetical protein n=1 Tax=Sphingobacterium thalpophilum TaxID=259 RepID=UPI0024A766FE|nr:hypothetical protein [Sphingobacterium thalpophilum]
MNTNAKKMYVAPSIKEHVIELEQGIAAGSQATPGATPQSSGWGAGPDEVINGEGS